MNEPKDAFSASLIKMCLFLSKVANDDRVPEDLKEEAADVGANFMVSALLNIGSKARERADRGESVPDVYGRSRTCGNCQGRGYIKLETLNETMTCPCCGGSGRGF